MVHHHVHKITNENERKTFVVIIITIITMFVEIVYGYLTNSMALLADGYHMGTHALALSLTYVAYILIRRFKDSQKFPTGTNKIGTLAAYTSSLFLGLTGVWIIYEGARRIVSPIQIEFNEAILIAVIGLVINLICIMIMGDSHKDEHCHNEDYNFKAAYYHILADVLTSILAILALIAGKYFNVVYLDSCIGLLGGVLILRWALNLLKDTIKVLIDMK